MASAAERELERQQAALTAAQERVETERALAAAVLPPLPSDALELIFSLLPVDVRLRCREVSRSWRSSLSSSSYACAGTDVRMEPPPPSERAPLQFRRAHLRIPCVAR